MSLNDLSLLRPTVLATTLALLGAGPDAWAQATAPAAAAPAAAKAAMPADAMRTFDIPAQPLGSSLARIASESGQSISLDAALVRGIQAPAVRGRYTAEEAARAAIANSGLALRRTDSGSWALYRIPASSGADGVVALGAVLVTGQALGGTATEHTGGYLATAAGATATPLALTLKETPQSVTVLTRQRLDDQKADSLIDALEYTPGVTAFRQGMGTDLTGLWSRGFNVSNFLFDGIPSESGASTYWQNTAMYDRIEVVRGASGLMSGMGSPAASINLVRKRPTADPQASVNVELGNWQRRGLGADVSGPLNAAGSVRGRLVLDMKNQESWIDRYAVRNRLVYGVAEADLGEATLLTAGFSHQVQNNASPLRTGLPLTFADGTPTQFRRGTNTAPDWSYHDNAMTNVFVTVQHAFEGGWSGKMALGHTLYRYDSGLYFLTGALDAQTGLGGAVWPVRWQSSDKQATLDAQVSGPFTLLGRQHDLVAGVSLSQTRRDTPGYGGWMGPWTGYDGTIGDLRIWDGQSNVPVFVKEADTHTRENQTSAYASTRLRLTDATSLIGGLRISNWSRTADTTTVAGAYSQARTEAHGVVVPYAGVVHALDETWSVYASYTKIFSPQSAATRDIDNNVLDPERGVSYEAGVKASFNEERLNASLALFRTRQDNFASYNSALAAYEALQGITTKGVDLELTGALTRGWNLGAGYTYTASRDAAGLRAVTQIPRHSAKLFTTYRFAGALNRLTVGGGVSWQSQAGYVGEFQQSGYAVASLMARYAFSPQLAATINVNNVFDKHYYSGLSAYGGVYGAPRNVMFSAVYTF